MPPIQKIRPFHMFLEDYIERERAKGKEFSHEFRDECLKCFNEWQELDSTNKIEYEQRAQDIKNCLSDETALVPTVPVNIVEETEFDKLMIKEIADTIYTAHKYKSVPSLSFFMIHVNHYYEKKLDDLQTDYIPAEYAVIEFSLNEGPKKYLYQIIKTELVNEYTSEDEKFLLDVCSYKRAEYMIEGGDDYRVMFQNLVEFLKTSNEHKLPPIYTSSHMMKIVPCLLKRLTNAADVGNNFFSLYSLEYLHSTMLSINHDKDEYPKEPKGLKFSYKRVLERGSFYYLPNLECDYHRQYPGNKNYCSLSIVRQWIYIICGDCCSLYNVTMVEGLHKPKCDVSLPGSAMQAFSFGFNLASEIQSALGVSSNYKAVNQLSSPVEESLKATGELTITDPIEITEKKNNTIVIPSAENLPSTSGNLQHQEGNMPQPANASSFLDISDTKSFPPLGKKKRRK